jgi:AcrR family transcriptional regulator
MPAPKRSDAERNRAKILVVARAAFAEQDADVSMAEIARRAGIGMATLYRNFPGRRELLEALYADEVDGICAAAETIDAQTPGAALLAWLRQAFAFFASKHQVAALLLKQPGADDHFFNDNRSRVLAAGRPLLEAAQHSCEIRDDLSIEQVLDAIAAVAHVQRPSDYLEPILLTVLDGLRVSAGSA